MAVVTIADSAALQGKQRALFDSLAGLRSVIDAYCGGAESA